MMTQRAKLRRLAFIDFPSWSRGSRPYVLDSNCLGNNCLGNKPWVVPWPTGENPRSPLHNLGGAGVDAKGSEADYLAHPSAIPGQIMAVNPCVFRGWLRLPAGL